MESPLSFIIANLVLNDLEEKALNLELTFYHRYVDYITMVAPSEHINHIINTFNSFHERL